MEKPVWEFPESVSIYSARRSLGEGGPFAEALAKAGLLTEARRAKVSPNPIGFTELTSNPALRAV